VPALWLARLLPVDRRELAQGAHLEARSTAEATSVRSHSSLRHPEGSTAPVIFPPLWKFVEMAASTAL